MATHLTAEQMKRVAQAQFEELVNRRNVEVIRANMSPDFVDHSGPGGKLTGVNGDERMMRAVYAGMPIFA